MADVDALIERHLNRLPPRHSISAAEEAAIRGLPDAPTRVPAGTLLIRAGKRLENSTLLLDGFLSRYKDMANGRRQVTEVAVPGDFADLHSFALKRLDHDIAAMSDCIVATVPHEKLEDLTRTHPRLTRIYWFTTNLDAAIHREWELSLGQRSAEQRLAALICELQVRLGLIGMADESGFDLPLKQVHLSECVGLTPVHVNRMLRVLRERGLMSFSGARVTLHDLPGLRRLAEFDEGYLYLHPDPL